MVLNLSPDRGNPRKYYFLKPLNELNVKVDAAIKLYMLDFYEFYVVVDIHVKHKYRFELQKTNISAIIHSWT